jgi:DNA-binding NarL/FixJ family response regulator
MATLVEITQGAYGARKNLITPGIRLQMVKDFDGEAITCLAGDEIEGGRNPYKKIRVKVSGINAYRVVAHIDEAPVGENSLVQLKVADTAVAHITDDELIEKTRARFQVLTDMTKAVKAGDVRAMIVTGPPGVGKSFGVEEVLTKDDLFNTLGERKPRYEIVKGAMSAIGLYSKLYEFSSEKNVIVFDDCDSVLLDDLSLNILKAALDSSKKRTISWNTDSRILRSEGIPDRFEFKAGAIFITNIKFENVRSKKLQDHLAALESRCHYIDLQMDTDREKVLRIKQIVADGMLDEYELSDVAKIDVVDFVSNNRAKLRELSLRTVLKVAQLRKAFADNWEAMAEVTVMKRGVA